MDGYNRLAEKIIDNDIRELNIDPTQLDKTLHELKPREELVVRLRYGLTGSGDPWIYREIGAHLGISHERVRQILNTALRKLRHPIRTRRFVLSWKQAWDDDNKEKLYEWLCSDPKDTSLEELYFSVRAYNAIKSAGFKEIKDIIFIDDREILKIRNVGKHTLREIRGVIAKFMKDDQLRREKVRRILYGRAS